MIATLAPHADAAVAPAWPTKTREMRSHHFDSTIWNDLQFRDDDIIVSTYAKSGTTWTQQIVGQLVFQGDPTVNIAEISPWLDLRVPPKEVKLPLIEAQTHRRIMKTHLPVEALVYSPRAKYIYIARDGRDVAWSLFHHHQAGNADFYAALNDTPGLVGPRLERPHTDDPRRYFLDWLARDGAPFWSLWENVVSWWAIRHLPNLLFVHFADLKRDLPGEMRRIADFLDITVDDARWPQIVEHCTFDWMKANAPLVAPLGGALWEGGADSFIHKGTNGRWRDHLTADDIALYEQTALARLGRDAARWLAEGGAV
ncbi:MAG: sulfotransferase domain-containing protein [Alphaproteobacteria bacterium]|nr:sulfotransferase domain-containing protein [Alphaproteobacteria bacterium]